MRRSLVLAAVLSGFLVPIGFFSGPFLGFPVLGVLAAGVALAAWNHPDGTLLALIALAPLSRSPDSHLFSPQLVVVTRAIWAVIFAGVWWIKRGLTGIPKEPLPVWLVAFLVAWAFLASAAMLNAQSWEEGLPHVTVCIGGVSLFLVVWKAPPALHKKIAAVVMLGAVGVACISLLQYAILRYEILPALWPYIMAPREQLHMALHPPEMERIWRVSGTFLHANGLGTYFSLVIPFICAGLSLSRLTRPQRFLLAAALLLVGFGLYATNSRGNMLAVAASLLFLAVHRGHRWLIAVAALCGLVVAALYVSDAERFTDYIHSVSRVEFGLSSRDDIWPHVIDLIQHYPATGVGPGNLPAQYESHFGFFVFHNPAEILEQVWDVQIFRENLINSFHAHNTILMVIGEYGWAGLPLFLFGVFALIWKAEKRARGLPIGSFGRTMALGAASFGVGYLVSSQFDSYVGYTEMGLLLLGTPLMAMGLKSV